MELPHSSVGLTTARRQRVALSTAAILHLPLGKDAHLYVQPLRERSQLKTCEFEIKTRSADQRRQVMNLVRRMQ